MTERRHRPNAQARRRSLLVAAVEIAAESGVAGVTHRAVTERAGLPLATVSYFFSSIDELTQEALRVFADEDAQANIAVAQALSESSSNPDEVLEAFVAVAQPRMPQTLALIEAYLHAARDESFRDAVSSALAAARGAAGAGIKAAGAPEGHGAEAFVALIQGFALHEAAVPGAVEPDVVRDAFRALFLGYLLDNGYVDEAVALVSASRDVG